MSDLKNFKLAIFVRDQKYYEQILKYLEKSTKEILVSLINDKPLKPGSYRSRKNTAPEKISINNEENHA